MERMSDGGAFFPIIAPLAARGRKGKNRGIDQEEETGCSASGEGPGASRDASSVADETDDSSVHVRSVEIRSADKSRGAGVTRDRAKPLLLAVPFLFPGVAPWQRRAVVRRTRDLLVFPTRNRFSFDRIESMDRGL